MPLPISPDTQTLPCQHETEPHPGQRERRTDNKVCDLPPFGRRARPKGEIITFFTSRCGLADMFEACVPAQVWDADRWLGLRGRRASCLEPWDWCARPDRA